MIHLQAIFLHGEHASKNHTNVSPHLLSYLVLSNDTALFGIILAYFLCEEQND
jgi:hypothetical protein